MSREMARLPTVIKGALPSIICSAPHGSGRTPTRPDPFQTDRIQCWPDPTRFKRIGSNADPGRTRVDPGWPQLKLINYIATTSLTMSPMPIITLRDMMHMITMSTCPGTRQHHHVVERVHVSIVGAGWWPAGWSGSGQFVIRVTFGSEPFPMGRVRAQSDPTRPGSDPGRSGSTWPVAEH